MTSKGKPPAGDSPEPRPLPPEKRKEPRVPAAAIPEAAEVPDLQGTESLIPGDFVSPPAEGASSEARGAKRGLVLEAILFQVPGQPSVHITLRNTSRRGMGFFCRRSFQVGDRFAVRLHFAKSDGRLVLCQVRHCTEMKAGWYDVGVEFLEALRPKGNGVAIPRRWILGSGT